MKRNFDYWFNLVKLLEDIINSGNLTYEQVGRIVKKVKAIRIDEFNKKVNKLRELSEKEEDVTDKAKELFEQVLEVDVEKFDKEDIKDIPMDVHQYLQIKAFIKI